MSEKIVAITKTSYGVVSIDTDEEENITKLVNEAVASNKVFWGDSVVAITSVKDVDPKKNQIQLERNSHVSI